MRKTVKKMLKKIKQKIPRSLKMMKKRKKMRSQSKNIEDILAAQEGTKSTNPPWSILLVTVWLILKMTSSMPTTLKARKLN